MAIHEHFARICELRGVRFAEIARRAGVNQSVITRLKQRETDSQFELVRAVARILEVTIDYLGGEKGNAPPNKTHLALEALELFCRTTSLSIEQRAAFEVLARDPSSPMTVGDWKQHLDRL